MADAATRLFARQSPEDVTVAEIAEEAGMTSAAVYYHFSSKDDILLEVLRSFGAHLVTETRRLQSLATPGGSLGDLVVGLLRWAQQRPEAATVWFVYSAGLSLAVESLRRGIRAELVVALLGAARVAQPDLSAAEAAAVAAALLALLDTTAVTWLVDDGTREAVGEQEFLDLAAELAGRLA